MNHECAQDRDFRAAATASHGARVLRRRWLAVAVLLTAGMGLGARSSAAESITLRTFGITGAAEATISSPSSSGAKLEWGVNNGSNDKGLYAILDGGGFTFSNVGDALTYTFTYSDITLAEPAANLSTPVFRTGFDFGSSAFVYHMTSTGTQPNLGFYANTNGNPFNTGSQVGSRVTDWSPFNNKFIRMATGNTIEVTVSLTLDATDGSTYDYTYEVTYTGGGDSNTASQAFTGIASNTIDRIFHGVNNSGVAVDGNAFTVSNASIVTVPKE